jgi:hypothetical protein
MSPFNWNENILCEISRGPILPKGFISQVHNSKTSFINQVHNSDLLSYQKNDQFEFPPFHTAICFMFWNSKLASCTLPKFDYILKWFTNVLFQLA